jgi:hypothetical protein
MVKVAFCSQVLIITFGLPSLFYAVISYNKESKSKMHLLKTNKEKRY